MSEIQMSKYKRKGDCVEEPKFKCDCNKEIKDVYKPPSNFKYAGCDESNNPVFECKDCKVSVWG